MSTPKILVIPGSLRRGSHNSRLAAVAAKTLMEADADVTRISLADYPLPIYDADLATESGPPAEAVRLKQLVCAHAGLFIASPEYNASITPLLKNAIDWISAVREAGDPPLAAYQNRVFALGAASPGRSGGMQSLIALRQVLAVGCHVGQREPAARSTRASSLAGRRLVGERAERAFAQDAVDARVSERQPLGVADDEAHPPFEAGHER